MTEQEVVSVLVGAPVSAGLSNYQAAALAISVALGVVNLVWTGYLARLTRSRSVEDEFWFRKVVGPSVIDKSLEFSSKWTGELSRASDLKGAVSSTRKRVDECKRDADGIIMSCLCLKLYSVEQYQGATRILDAIVDEVTECLHAVSSKSISDQEVQKVVELKRQNISVQIVNLLAAMKALQHSF